MKAVVNRALLTLLFFSSVWAEAIESEVGSRFVRYDGYIKDRKTNLLWQLKDDKRKNDRFTYSGAKKECESLTIAGFGGWRLPEFEELKALADAKNEDAAGFLKIFTDLHQKYYRTNMTAGDFTNASLVVGFKVGSVAEVSNNESVFVRCVTEVR